MAANANRSPTKQISGLPSQRDFYEDIHMNTAKGLPTEGLDIHMNTAKGYTLGNDVRMDTAKGSVSTIRQNGLPMKDRAILESGEVKRKATVAQLCTFLVYLARFESNSSVDFLDYYFQMLGYTAARKERRALFDKDTKERGLTATEYAKEFKSYSGRERVVLRKRRTKLRVDQFHIIAQVGQGGYGEVFLARKQETGEVCALKKMKKRTLHKMDEVRKHSNQVFSSQFTLSHRYGTFSLRETS